MIRVAVSGAAGRMGQTTCQAVEAAPDMELVARVDPALGAMVLTGQGWQSVVLLGGGWPAAPGDKAGVICGG